MKARPITLILLVISVFGTACDPATDSVQPRRDPPTVDPPAATTLEVLPSTVTLEQGNTVQLEVFVRDQRGQPIVPLGPLTFSSSDPAIATVSNGGFVTGVAPGAVDISVTKMVAGIAKSAAMKATVLQATTLANLVLTADPKSGWQPTVAHMTAGGTVQWVAGPRSWSDVPQRWLWLLDKSYSVVDSLDLSTGSATRKLEIPGEYRYCSAGCWDPPDFGVVYVH